MTTKEKNWIPIESNPDLMNKYIHSLGVPHDFSFTDVLGVDDDLLQLTPQPVLAVGLLFPITEASERHKEEEEKLHISSEGDQPWFTLQTVGNACGTVMLLHCIYNNLSKIKLIENEFFDKFYRRTINMSPLERANSLMEDESIENSHQSIAQAAVSDVQHQCNDNLHFVSFIHFRGQLFELDGRKKRPINHGKTSEATLLYDAAQIVKKFMGRSPNDIRFNLCCLVPTSAIG